MSKSYLLLFLLLPSFLTSTSADAQTSDPRDYEVAYFVPHRTTLINTYIRHQTGTKERDYSADAAVFRATYILKFGNLVVTPLDALLPIIDQRGFVPLSNTLSAFNPAFAQLPEDLKLTVHAAGVGDLTLLPTIGHGFVQNAANHTHTWYALTTYITAPTGKYDPAHLLNVGSNRWTINPLVMVGQRFWHVFTLEATANMAFYTHNDQYRVPTGELAGRNLTLKQARSIGAAVHLAVDLHPLFYVGASYLVNENGRRDSLVPSANGSASFGETASNTVQSFRLNFGIRVTPQTLVLVQWNEDVAGTPSAATGRFFGLPIGHAFWSAVQKATKQGVPNDPDAVHRERSSARDEEPVNEEPADDE